METSIAILMADLSGYTAMTHAHGGASAAKIVQKYMQMVEQSLVGSSKVFQRIGDQVVITSANADDILETARQLNRLINDEHHFLPIHVGLHYGTVFIEDGNLFGSTINIAARIMNFAQRGQILCSSHFLLQLNDQTSFKSVGLQRLKNVVEDYELFEHLTVKNQITFLIDPVCHMQIDPARCQFFVTLADITYHFCSEQCREAFQKCPESFTRDM
jgi:adenylate cyclase